MPALELFGRRWHISADDLPLPSLMGALWHLAILVLSSVDVAYVREQLDSSCPYRTRHIAYLSTHVFCFVVNSVLHTWTFFESVRGTMFQVHRRRRVAPLVVAIIFFYCLTIASNGYGTRLVYLQQSMPQCEPLPGALDHLNQFALTEAIVVATWVSLFVGFTAIVITLNLFSTYQAASSPWLSRFRLYRVVCFCCLGPCEKPDEGGNDADTEKDRTSTGRNLSPMVVIANIFTHIFGGVDMVLTDYMAAFTLLGVRHSHSKPALTYANARPPQWLAAGSGSGGVAAEAPGGNWRAGSAAGVILQPPPVVEIAANGRSKGGGGGGGGGAQPSGPDVGALAVNHVVLDVGPADTTPAAGSKPPTTITTTSDAASNGTVPAATTTASTITTTTTSAPSTPAGATIVIADSRSSANECAKPASAAAMHTNRSCTAQQRDVEAVAVGGAATPRSPTAPEEGGDVGCHLRGEWDSSDLAQPNASDEVMEEALYYMRFATAVYGWKMFLWMNRLKVTNCCRLCLGRSCGCCRQSSYFIRAVGPDYGPSEGCCTAAKLLEREAITQLTEVPDDDILYVCYDNCVGGLLPYYVALDRQRSSVVVGVRGSLSLSDVVTDLLCEPAEYDVPGVPSTDASGRRVLWAHRGMMEATSAILRDIREQGVLQAVVAEWPEGEAAQQQALQDLPSERARAVAQRLRGACSGYRVVITGHSLGAGVTGLLGPLLQKQFPNLRCWAFAPPGGLMSPKAAELTHGFCISLTHAKDMIPRLRVASMEALVQDLVDASVHSRVNKLSVMGRLIALGERPPLEHLFHPSTDHLKPELQVVMDKYNNRLRGTPNWKVGEQFNDARDFVPPGHMLYVERRKRPDVEPPCCCSCNVCLLDKSAVNANYVCRWIQVEDLMSTGLVVSRSMFMDHLPDNTLYAMQAALRQMRGETAPSQSWLSFGRKKKGGGGSSASSKAPSRAAAPDAVAALPGEARPEAAAAAAAKDSPV